MDEQPDLQRARANLRAMITVCGAGGAIGGHLVNALVDAGQLVRAVDIKSLDEWWQVNDSADNIDATDLSDINEAQAVCEGAHEVYMLAADMGGMGFITNHKLACMLSVIPSTNMLLAAASEGVGKFFYSSSACVYPGFLQKDSNVEPLSEDMAYPADPEDGYGWEKLFTERMCRHFYEESGLDVRIARFHNVFGEHATWIGGREKAPAALCRKVAMAKLLDSDVIEIWGDGKATRSFLYVSDAVEGSMRLMRSDYSQPINIGSDFLISVDDLVTDIEIIANVGPLKRIYNENAPQGVRGRCSDNTLVSQVLGWKPHVTLLEGLGRTYRWIEDQVRASL
jgi:GDP-D-mannose 3',5'-epimerase